MSEATAPITLVTGLPGAGKTAYVVDLLAHSPDLQGRPLFVMGIPELKIDHSPVPPVKEWTEMRPDKDDPSVMLPYFTFPPNSVIILDEAQRIYRPRSTGSRVPDIVAAFETVRHTGVDFILMTQHPGLLDSNIRLLVGRHMHIHVTPVGRKLLEWRGIGSPADRTSRELAARRSYSPPKRVFDLYKSSELHTKVKVAVPWQYYLFAVALLIMLVLGYVVYQRVTRVFNPEPETPQLLSPGQASASSSSSGSARPVVGVREYVQLHTPRLAGLEHTAPVYDEITKPTDAPWPAACMKTAKFCRCFDQQGTRYPTTEAICGQIIEKGMFRPFSPREKATTARAEPSPSALKVAAAMPSAKAP